MKRMIFNMAAAFIIRFIVIYFIGLTQQGWIPDIPFHGRKIADGTIKRKQQVFFGIFPLSQSSIFISFMYKLIGETT